MKNNHKKAVAVLCGTMMAASLSLTACGGASTAESVDLREVPLDTILEKAKAEGQINSVGMPDDWANWRGSWAAVSEKYGLTHEDTDMSSAEELSTFETEKDAATKDIGDVGQAFGPTAVEMDEEAMRHIARIANGDVRSALGALELAVLTTEPGEDGVIHITMEVAEESIQKPVIRCDESLYYDMLSAFCKSLRGSDADAAMAWFARLLYAGVDPRLIARRIIAHASEDVGLANPTAMLQAVAASQALEAVGLPEARLSMAQAIIAICESPKSNSVVMALDQSVADAEKGGFGPVPIHLRDTHYAGHERLGSGAQYQYPHDFPGHWVKQEYMPPEVKGRRYYIPSDQGQELKLRERRKLRGIIDP